MNNKNNTIDSTGDQITSIHLGTILSDYIECHGCLGKGWIENSKGDLKICPICEGKGKLDKEKGCDEMGTWHPYYPRYPCHPWPSRIDDPCWPTYPIVTYCNVKTKSDTLSIYFE